MFFIVLFFVFLFFFCFVFLFGFYGLFKNISLISSRSFIKGGRKPENPGKTTWPSVIRTWLSHMWPERGSNHSGKKPNGLRVSPLIHQATRAHIWMFERNIHLQQWIFSKSKIRRKVIPQKLRVKELRHNFGLLNRHVSAYFVPLSESYHQIWMGICVSVSWGKGQFNVQMWIS